MKVFSNHLLSSDRHHSLRGLLPFQPNFIPPSAACMQQLLSLVSMTSIKFVGDGKWHGTIDIIIAAPVERVWAIASDWLTFPRRCSVECTEGTSGVPGCVRRVRPHDSGHWAAEKLVHIDHNQHILAYDLVGGNIGIEPGYQAIFHAIKEGDGKTRVVWPFRFSPTQRSVESFIPLIVAKVTGYIKELEALAQK